MNKPQITLSLFLLFSFFKISIAADAGFDEICKIYTETLNSNMTKKVASNYVL